MSTQKKGQNLWGVVILSAILCGLSYWGYVEFSTAYMNTENSNRMIQSLLQNQTQFVRAFSQQMNEYKKNLQETQDVLAKAQSENTELKGQLAKLDTVNALEARVAQLEQANNQMKQDMELASAASKTREDELHAKLEEVLAEQNFKTVDEGRAVLAKYRNKIREIKAKIRGFQIDTRNQEIAARKAQDNALLLAGNNGFMVRNGNTVTMNVASQVKSPDNKNVAIDVTFVK